MTDEQINEGLIEAIKSMDGCTSFNNIFKAGVEFATKQMNIVPDKKMVKIKIESQVLVAHLDYDHYDYLDEYLRYVFSDGSVVSDDNPFLLHAEPGQTPGTFKWDYVD